MKFSIIICTYNQADSLQITLEGLRHQKLPEDDIELIVVDNNSTDHTRDICEANFQLLPFSCHYIFEARQGLSAARNRGSTEARGEYVIFTDDDAGLPSDWLFNYSQAYQAYDADCIFGRISVDWEKGKPAWYSPRFGPMFVELNYGAETLVITDNHHEFFGKNFSLRRELLQELGGFDENLGRKGNRLFAGEETRIYRWLVEKSFKVMYCPEILVYHRLKDYEYTEEHCYRHARDTTVSEYYMLQIGSGRKFFGRSLYALRKVVGDLAHIFYACLTSYVNSEYSDRFYIKVSMLKTMLLLKLWIFKNDMAHK